MKPSQLLWVEKYAPHSIDECILPPRIKDTFKTYVEGGLPNLLLSGPAGSGKTSSIKAMSEEMGFDLYMVNGSNEGRFLDTIRNGVTTFCTSISMFNDKRKVVLIDEADNTTHDVQDLLRGLIEEFQGHTSFVFTCNNKHKLTDAMHSRFTDISFSFTSVERAQLCSEMLERLMNILDENNIEYEPKVIAALIKKFQPDWRKCLHELQKYSRNGVIDEDVLASIGDVRIKELINAMKQKKAKDIRTWIVANIDSDARQLLRALYDAIFVHLEPSSIGDAVLIVAEYMHRATRDMDPEINMFACAVELMNRVEFK